MRIIKKLILASTLFLSFTAIVNSQESGKVSVSQEVQVLSKGTKNIFRSDIYYNRENDVIIVHHTYPSDFVKISNKLGEEKIYFPKTNTVSIQQDATFSSANDLLYYFVNNKTSDLGLAREGFKLISTEREEGMLVTIWQAPPSLKVVNLVKMVFRDMLPVYAEYTDPKGKTMKKIYYSKYSDQSSFSLPMRITEISYEGKTDSVIRLSLFSDVRTSGFPDNNYFDFKIPADAKTAK